MTFINNLVEDLRDKLEPLANVSTFHGFCRRLLHISETPGISSEFRYYPELPIVVASDISLVEDFSCDEGAVQEAFHTVSDDQSIITWTLRSGNYYDAVGHDDSVYRVLRHFEANPGEIPEYSVVIVDEYQDFNLLEVEFIALLSERSPVLIAGDDDQALYIFKHATADYLRALAHDGEFVRFELPFCSRCTDVVVRAAICVVSKAQEIGLLSTRIDKPFVCYTPDKAGDSAMYPRIIHADCTVQKKNAPYMCNYVHHKIHEIPDEDIAESREQGYPTVLIAGPRYFTRPLYELICDEFHDIEFRERSESKLDTIGGYLRLENDEQDRLGWRIVLHNDPVDNLVEILRSALNNGEELSEIIPADYRAAHLHNVGILRRLRSGAAISADEKRMISQGCGMAFGEIAGLVCQEQTEPTLLEQEDEDAEEEDYPMEPRIVITTLVGAKGLDAGHVFILGLNEGHLPKDNRNPSEDEVCGFLVGLTRTRKCCHLVSCGRFGANWQTQSIFIDWIRPFLETETVNKAWIQAAGAP